jgi:hypothetical protein
VFRRKERAIIFGAGLAGRRALRCLYHRYRIIAFSDNDVRKHGKSLMRRPIVSPAAISSLSFARLFIASAYSAQIMPQLMNELGIDPMKIEVVRNDIINGEYDISPWTRAILAMVAILAIGAITAFLWYAFGLLFP